MPLLLILFGTLQLMNQSMVPKKDIFWTRIKMDSLKLLKGRTEKIRRIQSEQL